MRMRALATAAVAGAALSVPALAAAAIGATSSTNVRVAPAKIHPSSNVVLRFTQPRTTGVRSGKQLTEFLRTSGPQRAGCTGSSSARLAGADAGTPMRVTLRPRQLGGPWCTGAFTGVLVLDVQPSCPVGGPVHACPMWIMRPQTLARFRFHVTR